MRTYQSAHILYFSGTGGTSRIAQIFKNQLEQAGADVIMSELTSSHMKQGQLREITSELLVLLYPVYAFSAPLSVHEWLDTLMPNTQCHVALFSVSGGGEMFPNTASRYQVIKQLKQKSFNVVYERMFVMPGNLAIAYDNELIIQLLNKAPLIVKKVLKELSEGIERHTKPLWIDRILIIFAKFQKKAGKSFGNKFKIADTCNGCSLCAIQCPRSNIKMENNRPTFDHNCVICMRCIYNCPKRAIHPRLGKYIVLKNGYQLEKIEDLMIQDKAALESQLKNYKIPKSILFKGVRKYLDEPC